MRSGGCFSWSRGGSGDTCYQALKGFSCQALKPLAALPPSGWLPRTESGAAFICNFVCLLKFTRNNHIPQTSSVRGSKRKWP